MEKKYYYKGEQSLFPFKALSYSNLRKYTSDRNQWFARYIKGEDFTAGESMFIGAVVHKAIELYLTDQRTEINSDFFKLIDLTQYDLNSIDLEKTIKVADFCFQEVKKLIENNRALKDEVDSVESTFKKKIKFNIDEEEEIEVPMMAIADVVTHSKVYDWKIVSKFSGEETKPTYYLQAYFIFKTSPKPLSAVNFVEVKKTKNRDTALPQVNTVVVSRMDFLHYEPFFDHIITLMIKELLGIPLKIWAGEVIPNLADMLDGKQSFDKFISNNFKKNGN